MRIQDPSAEHEIRLRWLGNTEVFVTCKCYDKVRAGWRGKTAKNRFPNRHHVRGSSDWKSLGDFPMGTPTSELYAAYIVHLPLDHPDRQIRV